MNTVRLTTQRFYIASVAQFTHAGEPVRLDLRPKHSEPVLFGLLTLRDVGNDKHGRFISTRIINVNEVFVPHGTMCALEHCAKEHYDARRL